MLNPELCYNEPCYKEVVVYQVFYMILYYDTLTLLIFSIFVTKYMGIVLMLSMLGENFQ